MGIDAQREARILQRLFIAHIPVHQLRHEHQCFKMIGIGCQRGLQLFFCLWEKLLRHGRPRLQAVPLGRLPVKIGRRCRRPLHNFGLLIKIVYQFIAPQRQLPVHPRHTAAYRIVERL